jgi:hypothetical protein
MQEESWRWNTAAEYFQRTQDVAGVKGYAFNPRARCPSLAWNAKIVRMISIIWNYDTIVESGITILERVPIETRRHASPDSKVEIVHQNCCWILFPIQRLYSCTGPRKNVGRCGTWESHFFSGCRWCCSNKNRLSNPIVYYQCIPSITITHYSLLLFTAIFQLASPLVTFWSIILDMELAGMVHFSLGTPDTISSTRVKTSRLQGSFDERRDLTAYGSHTHRIHSCHYCSAVPLIPKWRVSLEEACLAYDK